MPITADVLRQGVIAEILELAPTAMGQQLAEIGFWPGKQIELLVLAPFGDPLAFKIDNNFIALRRDEAKNIVVSPELSDH